MNKSETTRFARLLLGAQENTSSCRARKHVLFFEQGTHALAEQGNLSSFRAQNRSSCWTRAAFRQCRDNQGAKVRQKSQSCLTGENYMGQQHWDLLKDTDVSWERKQQVFTNLLEDIGCSKLTEYTFTRCIAIETMACNQEQTLTIYLSDCVQRKRDLQHTSATPRRHRPTTQSWRLEAGGWRLEAPS